MPLDSTDPPRSPAHWPWTIIIMVAIAAALMYAIATQRVSVVFESDSEFGDVRVTERSDGLRSLYTGDGRARQSAIYPGRPMQLVHEYTRVGMVGLALVAPDARILFVGLGGGAMPMYARQVMPAAHIDVVEIDPVIVAVAARWFGFVPDDRMLVHTGDGRAFIENAAPGTYDLIVLDAFSDDEVPYSLTTRQFLDAVRARLTTHGAVVSNLWTAQRSYEAMLATYAAVFDQVHLLRVPQRAQRILVAGSAARPLDRPALVSAVQALADRVELGFDLTRLVEDGYEPAPRVDAPVLEDVQLSAPMTGSERAGFVDGWRQGPREWVRAGVCGDTHAHSRVPGNGADVTRRARVTSARQAAANHGSERLCMRFAPGIASSETPAPAVVYGLSLFVQRAAWSRTVPRTRDQ